MHYFAMITLLNDNMYFDYYRLRVQGCTGVSGMTLDFQKVYPNLFYTNVRLSRIYSLL